MFFAISSTLSLYVASVVQRLALKEKNRKEQNQNQCGLELEQNIQHLILTNSRATYIAGKIQYSRFRKKRKKTQLGKVPYFLN